MLILLIPTGKIKRKKCNNITKKIKLETFCEKFEAIFVVSA